MFSYKYGIYCSVIDCKLLLYKLEVVFIIGIVYCIIKSYMYKIIWLIDVEILVLVKI